MFAVNLRAIKKLITSDKEQLHAIRSASLEIFGNMVFFAHSHIYGDAGIIHLRVRALANFAVKWENDAHFVIAFPQFMRKRLENIDNRARPLQWRCFCANH